jgi:DNA-binding HxlR family transcriptional regulator
MSSEHHTAFTRTRGGQRPSIPTFTDVEGTLVSMQEIVGRKWHPVIVYHLLDDGPQGFSSLKERVDGISSKMLSESLDDLEAAGLVDRTLLSDKPVRVEYELTEEGRTLEPLIGEMVQWGVEHDFGTTDAETDADESGLTRPTDLRVEGE